MTRQRKLPRKRLPPVRIPLGFDQAVSGLLGLNPKSPIEATKSTKKKPRPKK